MRVVMDLELESALQKVLSSAFSMRGSVFISYDNQHSMFEAPGKTEMVFIARDINLSCGCFFLLLKNFPVARTPTVQPE